MALGLRLVDPVFEGDAPAVSEAVGEAEVEPVKLPVGDMLALGDDDAVAAEFFDHLNIV